MLPSINLQQIAQKTLQQLADQLESQTDLDIELADYQLSIGENCQQNFLLNFHAPTHQLWLSSPVTGAHHFVFKEDKWKSTRTNISLTEIVEEDIRQYFKNTVNL